MTIAPCVSIFRLVEPFPAVASAGLITLIPAKTKVGGFAPWGERSRLKFRPRRAINRRALVFSALAPFTDLDQKEIQVCGVCRNLSQRIAPIGIARSSTYSTTGRESKQVFRFPAVQSYRDVKPLRSRVETLPN